MLEKRRRVLPGCLVVAVLEAQGRPDKAVPTRLHVVSADSASIEKCFAE